MCSKKFLQLGTKQVFTKHFTLLQISTKNLESYEVDNIDLF